MDPIVVGTDGTSHADQAVVWAAERAVRSGLPLHIVHCHTGSPGAAQQLVAEAAVLAARNRHGLAITTQLSADPPAVALAAHEDRAAEIVLGHHGLRRLAPVRCPVVVVPGASGDHGLVMVAIDGYDVSAAALDYACQTAAARRCRLLVVEVRAVPKRLRTPGFARLTALAVADAAAQLHASVIPWRAGFPGLEIAEEIVLGDPPDTLVALSEEVDLIVVGSRGLNRLQSMIYGSVSRRVLRGARCPVAVVPMAPVRAPVLP